MQIELKSRPPEAAGRRTPQAADQPGELALLAEFMRHDSVASLARGLARRIGGEARGDDLIAAAGLGQAAACEGGNRGSTGARQRPIDEFNSRAGLRR